MFLLVGLTNGNNHASVNHISSLSSEYISTFTAPRKTIAFILMYFLNLMHLTDKLPIYFHIIKMQNKAPHHCST